MKDNKKYLIDINLLRFRCTDGIEYKGYTDLEKFLIDKKEFVIFYNIEYEIVKTVVKFNTIRGAYIPEQIKEVIKEQSLQFNRNSIIWIKPEKQKED